MKWKLLALLAATTSLAAAPWCGAAQAAVIAPGSTFSVTATNFPGGNATAVVTVGGPAVTIAGATIGTTTLNTNGGNGEWISFDVTTTSTGGLAQNTGAGWNFTIDGLTMTAPALFDNAYSQWSVNGSPAPTQNSFGGLINQGNVNPITGLGPGYGGNPFTPGPAQTVYNFDPVIFVNPYSFVTAGGIPITANDFHELLHFTLANPPPGVPEPSTLVILATAVLGLMGCGCIRKSTGSAA